MLSEDDIFPSGNTHALAAIMEDYVKNSDYDFLISRGRMRSLLQYSAFVAELEAVLGTHVDVITDTSDDKQLIGTAEAEGVEIYGGK